MYENDPVVMSIAEMIWNARANCSDGLPAWTKGMSWWGFQEACKIMPAAIDLRNALLWQAHSIQAYLGHAGWKEPSKDTESGAS